MKRRILFLDIDGVLAGVDFLGTGNGFVDPEKVKLINKLSSLNVEIVISSSWGNNNGQTEKTLRDCGLKLPIIGYTEHFHIDWACRGNEIEKWIETNIKGAYTKFGGVGGFLNSDEQDDFNYCIVDDECDMLLGQKDHFVQTNSYEGISDNDINDIFNILNN